MFTGIIQAKGKVSSFKPNASGARLTIDRESWTPNREPVPGDSISIDGVCLTAANIDQSTIAFDVMNETLSKTTLGGINAGDPVNIEAPLAVGDPLGGHLVQGHIDGVGQVMATHDCSDECRIEIAPPQTLLDGIVPQGSIAIDGVSLTIAAVKDSAFEVALIPTTLKVTTLGDLEVGHQVNLETDILTKTIVHWLKRQGGQGANTVTMERLRESGFVK